MATKRLYFFASEKSDAIFIIFYYICAPGILIIYFNKNDISADVDR